MSVLKYGWFILHENAAFGSLHNVRGVSREWVRNSGVDGRPSRATVRFSVVGAIRRRFAFPAGHVFGTERKKAPVFTTTNFVHIPFEEAKMRRQFGAAYDGYVARVGRWL